MYVKKAASGHVKWEYCLGFLPSALLRKLNGMIQKRTLPSELLMLDLDSVGAIGCNG